VIKKIDHIGIFVHDLDEAITRYARLGLILKRVEVAEAFQTKVAFFECGGVLIELIVPLAPGPGTEFLEKHGEGIHHICYEVDDIEAQLQSVQGGLTLLDPVIRPGAGGSRVFFAAPDDLCGVVTEFAEMPEG
jgi:methylmalonyl-CoA/ethylmalonyl-CoA epimerase